MAELNEQDCPEVALLALLEVASGARGDDGGPPDDATRAALGRIAAAAGDPQALLALAGEE